MTDNSAAATQALIMINTPNLVIDSSPLTEPNVVIARGDMVWIYPMEVVLSSSKNNTYRYFFK